MKATVARSGFRKSGSRAINNGTSSSSSTLNHPTIIVSNLITAAVVFSLLNVLWSQNLLDRDCTLRRKGIFLSENKNNNIIDDGHNGQARDDALDHCPNSTMHTLTDENYILPSNTPFLIKIPAQFLKNDIAADGGMLFEEQRISSELKMQKQYPGGWKLIMDGRESCFEKLQQFGAFKNPDAKTWYFNKDTKEIHKRDVCMLAQVYVDGGIYVDADYELPSSVIEHLVLGVDVVSFMGVGGQQGMLQSVLGAPPGHPLIRHALEIAYSVIFNGMKLRFPPDSLGMGAVTTAIKNVYEVKNFNYQSLICTGIYSGSSTQSKTNVESISGSKLSLTIVEPPPNEKLWLLQRNNHPNVTKTIPRLISKVYLQKDGQSMDNSIITDGLREALDSWTIMNPGYKVQSFNLITARKYLNEYFNPIFLRAFDCVEAFAAKADFFRLVVLYRDGGWYSDWKQACLKENLLEDISKGTDFFAIKDNGNIYSRDNECVSNAFIGATPRHPIIAKSIEVVLKNVQGNYYGPHALDATGPCAFGLGIKGAQEQHGLKYDMTDFDFREEPPYTYYVRNDEKIILGKCADCGGNQDWEMGNNYITLWSTRNYYCQDATSIFR